MQLNKNKNYLYVKDAESNIIKEAFLVLKENIDIDDNSENKKLDKIDVIKDAEEFVNSVIKDNILKKYRKYKFKINFYRIISFIFGIYILLK